MEALTEAVRELRAEAEQLRRDLHRRTLPLWLTLAAVILIGGAVVLWNRVDIARSERQWCGTLTILTDPSPPPTSERARDSLRELTRLRDSFGCEPMQDPASG